MKSVSCAKHWLPLLVLLLAGCALMSRPESSETLQLLFDAASDAVHWPAGIAAGDVVGGASLQSDRVLAMAGARVMQYQGLRWVGTPEAMLGEQLRFWHARAQRGATAGAADVGRIDLALTRFALDIADDGQRTAVVSAFATLGCGADRPAITLAPVRAERALGPADGQVIATAFAAAAEEVVAALLDTAAARCAAQR